MRWRESGSFSLNLKSMPPASAYTATAREARLRHWSARAGDLRFVIASAAAGIDPADVETYSVGNSIGIAKLPPAERADAQSYVQALIDVAYRKNRAPLDAIAQALSQDHLLVRVNMIWAAS